MTLKWDLLLLEVHLLSLTYVISGETGDHFIGKKTQNKQQQQQKPQEFYSVQPLWQYISVKSYFSHQKCLRVKLQHICLSSPKNALLGA